MDAALIRILLNELLLLWSVPPLLLGVCVCVCLIQKNARRASCVGSHLLLIHRKGGVTLRGWTAGQWQHVVTFSPGSLSLPHP